MKTVLKICPKRLSVSPEIDISDAAALMGKSKVVGSQVKRKSSWNDFPARLDKISSLYDLIVKNAFWVKTFADDCLKPAFS